MQRLRTTVLMSPSLLRLPGFLTCVFMVLLFTFFINALTRDRQETYSVVHPPVMVMVRGCTQYFHRQQYKTNSDKKPPIQMFQLFWILLHPFRFTKNLSVIQL